MFLPTDSCPWEPKNPFSDHISGAGLEKQGQRQEALEIGTERIVGELLPPEGALAGRSDGWRPSCAGLIAALREQR